MSQKHAYTTADYLNWDSATGLRRQELGEVYDSLHF